MIEILTILISIMGFQSVKGGDQQINMIQFGGHAENEYFQGEVHTTGVDTQKAGKDGFTLSARYMIDGVDCAGDSCRIFIENNGGMGEYTKPMVVTDSKTLSFLNGLDLKGKLDMANGGLTIRVYADEKDVPENLKSVNRRGE